MKKRIIQTLGLLVVASCSLFAQLKEPVKWTVELKEVSQYEVQIIAHATIESGWKVYGLNVPEGGPVATEFTFEEGLNSRPIKKPVEKTKATVTHDAVFDMEVPYFKKEAVFTQNVRITARPAKIVGYVTFMCCDDETCLPPTDVDFEFDIK